ncbi:MAG: sodium:solute symporter family protein [Pseudobdellovibrionaceae bacterium]
MNSLDILIILLFIVYSIYSGFKAKDKASSGLEEYFLAGRSLKGWQAGISMAATQFAADTPLLVVGLIATAGIFSLWQLWIYAMAFLLLGFLLAPQWRRAQVLTDAEFSELRYGQRAASALRLIKAIYFGTIFNCVVLAWVLFAAAKISEPFLLWDNWLPPSIFLHVVDLAQWIHVPVTNLSITDPLVWEKTASNMISLLAIVGVTTLYSTTGGLHSVVMTDVAQFAIMILGTALFSFIVVSQAGGLDIIYEKISTTFGPDNPTGLNGNQILAFTPSQAKNVSFSVLALFALQWIIQLNSDGTGYLAQRSMACRSDFDSKIASLIFTVSQVLLRSLLWIPLGLGLLVLFPVYASLSPEMQMAAREGTYVRGIAELLPAGVKGLMVTAMLAALASTLDTHLNWGASYWTNDIYKRFYCQVLMKKESNPRTLIWVARTSNLLILLIAFLIMTRLSSIQDAWQTSLLLGAGMGPILLLRWFWWRINAWSEIAAIAVSALAAPILLVFVADPALRLLIIALISIVAALIATAWAGPEDLQLLKSFYQKVKPSGFWGPLAGHQQSRDRRNLARSLAATIFSSLSIFSLLVGIGSWLVKSPAPTWFPWQNIWALTCFLLGIGLTPLWIRFGFNTPKD